MLSVSLKPKSPITAVPSVVVSLTAEAMLPASSTGITLKRMLASSVKPAESVTRIMALSSPVKSAGAV